MGLLVDGVWHTDWYDTKKSGGRFMRTDAQFRNWVTPDGTPGFSGSGGFKAEAGRYHLYVGLACPWAHRTLIMRALKGLEETISLSVVHWTMGDNGWHFEPAAGVIPDPIGNARYMYEVYLRARPDYSGRVTVPVLWDKTSGQIVSNESSEIIRMFNSAFDGIGAAPGDYYPADLRAEIDAVNARVYDTLNNGVYKCGFATTQQAYDEAVGPLFETLDWLEARLNGHEWLVANKMSEADIRLFTTLVRFDLIYHGHFKCNLKRIADLPNLLAFTRRMCAIPQVRKTVDLGHCKRHYYGSQRSVNPYGIVPVGPTVDLGL